MYPLSPQVFAQLFLIFHAVSNGLKMSTVWLIELDNFHEQRLHQKPKQDPHCPWLLIMVITFFVLQSISTTGRLIELNNRNIANLCKVNCQELFVGEIRELNTLISHFWDWSEFCFSILTRYSNYDRPFSSMLGKVLLNFLS